MVFAQVFTNIMSILTVSFYHQRLKLQKLMTLCVGMFQF